MTPSGGITATGTVTYTLFTNNSCTGTGTETLTSAGAIPSSAADAWPGRGRPAAGYFTKRLAEEWLRSVLEDARRGTLPGLVQTGATFADAAAEWLE